jgi:hypothetical protein
MYKKLLSYGVQSNVFIDYFQMGEIISIWCISKLTREVVLCQTLSEVHSTKPTKADACKVIALHKEAHNIPVMLESFDVTKVHWKYVPTELRG